MDKMTEKKPLQVSDNGSTCCRDPGEMGWRRVVRDARFTPCPLCALVSPRVDASTHHEQNAALFVFMAPPSSSSPFSGPGK